MADSLLRGERHGYFGATYKLTAEAFDGLAAALGEAGEVRRAAGRILLPATGGSVEFWTLMDENAGRSRSYDEVSIDEAGLVPRLGSIWHEAIRPTLADRQGRAWFAGTPKGRNWFWTAFQLGRTDPEWVSFRMPTAMNPHIPAAEIEAARRGMPDRSFRQEFLAEFVEEGGGVFSGVREAVARGVAEREPEGPVSVGVDLARLEDWTVCTAVDASLRQVAIDRFSRMGWARQVERIAAFCRRFGAPEARVDATGVGDPVVEALAARGLRVVPVRFTAQSKQAMVDRLALLIERGELSLLDHPVQTAELEAFEYQPLPGGGVRAAAPAGMHDDCVAALMLAVASGPPRREWTIL